MAPKKDDQYLFDLALRSLQEASNHASKKGVQAQHMFGAMLDSYIVSRLGFGSTVQDVLEEVTERCEELKKTIPVPFKLPPLQ